METFIFVNGDSERNATNKFCTEVVKQGSVLGPTQFVIIIFHKYLIYMTEEIHVATWSHTIMLYFPGNSRRQYSPVVVVVVG